MLIINMPNLAKRLAVLFIFVLIFNSPSPALGADAETRLYSSALNELVSSISPIRFESPENGAANPLRIPYYNWRGQKKHYPICSGNWEADLKNVTFTILTTSISIDGNIDATWTCGIDFSFDSATFHTTANISADENNISISTNSLNVTITLAAPLISTDIPGVPSWLRFSKDVKFSKTIRVHQGLNFPPIPIRTTLLNFETAGGEFDLRVDPYSTTIEKKNGYIEIKSNVKTY